MEGPPCLDEFPRRFRYHIISSSISFHSHRAILFPTMKRAAAYPTRTQGVGPCRYDGIIWHGRGKYFVIQKLSSCRSGFRSPFFDLFIFCAFVGTAQEKLGGNCNRTFDSRGPWFGDIAKQTTGRMDVWALPDVRISNICINTYVCICTYIIFNDYRWHFAWFENLGHDHAPERLSTQDICVQNEGVLQNLAQLPGCSRA